MYVAVQWLKMHDRADGRLGQLCGRVLALRVRVHSKQLPDVA